MVRSAAPLALITALVLGLAACGDDGNAGSAGAPATVTPAPAATASPSPPPSPAPPKDGAATPAAPDATPSTPRCLAENLAGALDFGPGSGTAGASTGTLTLTNRGSGDCTLAGYPGVSMVDSAGRQLGRAAVRANDRYATITLAPGAGAQAPLRVADVSVFDATACQPTAAAGLRVYPPGSESELFIRHALRACLGDQEVLDVRPLAAAG